MNPPPSPVTSQPVPQPPPVVRPTLYTAIGYAVDDHLWWFSSGKRTREEAHECAENNRDDDDLCISIITIPGEVEEARDRKRWEAAMACVEYLKWAHKLSAETPAANRESYQAVTKLLEAFDKLEGAAS